MLQRFRGDFNDYFVYIDRCHCPTYERTSISVIFESETNADAEPQGSLSDGFAVALVHRKLCRM